jgi:hypothetical protein
VKERNKSTAVNMKPVNQKPTVSTSDENNPAVKIQIVENEVTLINSKIDTLIEYIHGKFGSLQDEIDQIHRMPMSSE